MSRTVRIVRKKQKTFPRPNLPDKPKVTEGPKSYGRSKKGGYIVPRFYITMHDARRGFKTNGKWFIVDVDEAKLAEGTDKNGYTREEAIKVARRFRDKYGAWSVLPF